MTEQDVINLKRTIYLTIMSSAGFEECAHKLMKLDLKVPLSVCHLDGWVERKYQYNQYKSVDGWMDLWMDQSTPIHSPTLSPTHRRHEDTHTPFHPPTHPPTHPRHMSRTGRRWSCA